MAFSEAVLEAVEECIDAYGTVGFQNQCGISATDFLDPIQTYLYSLQDEFEGSVYSQKEGTCVGIFIAPVLRDVYLARGNRRLQTFFEEIGVVKCFRYVDDFLVFFPIQKLTDTAREVVMERFREAHPG